MLKRTLFLICLALATAPAFATDPAATEQAAAEEESVKRFFARLFEDQATIFSTPARPATWKQPAAWAVAAISAGSFALDDKPSRELRENRDFRCFNDLLDNSPTGIVLHAYPVAVWLAGEATGSDGMRVYGRRSTRAVLNAAIAVTVIKAATQRSRPHTGRVYGFWEGGNSFYSGHSTVAWALAASTVKQFPKRRWVPWVAYPLAGAVSLSRVTSGNHFMSDAVVGSAVGFAIGTWVVD